MHTAFHFFFCQSVGTFHHAIPFVSHSFHLVAVFLKPADHLPDRSARHIELLTDFLPRNVPVCFPQHFQNLCFHNFICFSPSLILLSWLFAFSSFRLFILSTFYLFYVLSFSLSLSFLLFAFVSSLFLSSFLLIFYFNVASITALIVCIRFSASSNTFDCSDSNTSSVTSISVIPKRSPISLPTFVPRS